ncbi:MAG: bifunctional DNA primase/polymerase [Mycobacteriales bacterium]
MDLFRSLLGRGKGARGLLGAAAREYARRGWDVVPGVYVPGRDPAAAGCSCGDPRCAAPGAHPLDPDWQAVASRDAERVCWWWNGPHPYNVLLPTGRSFDVWDAPAYLGGPAADYLLEAVGQAATVVAVTPTGRWLLFSAPSFGDHPVPPLGCDVSCHGEGGYVPAPPSSLGPLGRVRWHLPPAGAWLPAGALVANVLIDAYQRATRDASAAIAGAPRVPYARRSPAVF